MSFHQGKKKEGPNLCFPRKGKRKRKGRRKGCFVRGPEGGRPGDQGSAANRKEKKKKRTRNMFGGGKNADPKNRRGVCRERFTDFVDRGAEKRLVFRRRERGDSSYSERTEREASFTKVFLGEKEEKTLLPGIEGEGKGGAVVSYRLKGKDENLHHRRERKKKRKYRVREAAAEK